MRLNFFKAGSPLFDYRWFIVSTLVVVSLMVYCDLAGRRLLSFSSQQQWSSSGPGSHK